MTVSQGVTLLTFANDIVNVAKGRTRAGLERKLNHTILLKCEWMETTELKHEPIKTKKVLPINRSKAAQLDI